MAGAPVRSLGPAVTRIGVGGTNLVSQEHIQMSMMIVLCWKNVYLVSELQ